MMRATRYQYLCRRRGHSRSKPRADRIAREPGTLLRQSQPAPPRRPQPIDQMSSSSGFLARSCVLFAPSANSQTPGICVLPDPQFNACSGGLGILIATRSTLKYGSTSHKGRWFRYRCDRFDYKRVPSSNGEKPLRPGRTHPVTPDLRRLVGYVSSGLATVTAHQADTSQSRPTPHDDVAGYRSPIARPTFKCEFLTANG
jgi:hypothetical protein